MQYIYCFTSSVFCAWLAYNSRNKFSIYTFSIISILIPSVFGGIRGYYVGFDIRVYAAALSEMAMKSNSLFEFLSKYRSEPGFSVLCYIGTKLFGHLNGSLFLYQLVTLSCMYIGAWKHRKLIPPYFTMLMYFFLEYNRTLCFMRNCIATSIIFMGLNNLYEKRYKRFLVYIIAATFFHYSAPITIGLLIGLHMIVTSEAFIKNFSVKLFFIGGMTMIVLSIRYLGSIIVGMIPIFAKYAGYFTGELNFVETQETFTLLVSGMLAAHLLYKKGALRLIKKFSHKYNYNFFIYNAMFIVFFRIFIKFMTRVIYYSEYVDIIIISMLPWLVKEKYFKILVGISVISVAAFYWWRLYIFGGYNSTWPYYTIL